MLEIKVAEIRGHCPVYNVGDTIMIDDPRVVLEKTDALCTHALSSLLHYVLVLEHGGDPVKLGLTMPEDREHAYLQCVDPGKPYIEALCMGDPHGNPCHERRGACPYRWIKPMAVYDIEAFTSHRPSQFH